MAGITLEQLEEDLAIARNARQKILRAQSYSVAGRSTYRAQLKEVNETIKDLNTQIQRLSRGGGVRVIPVTPCDT